MNPQTKPPAGERLEQLRLNRQLTWEQLAKLLKLTPSMLYQVARGDRALSDRALHRLAAAEAEAGLPTAQTASAAQELPAQGAVPAENLEFYNRAEKLKLAKEWTWEEAAGQLRISTTMLHFIKTGRNGVTKKAWHRLARAEAEAGLPAAQTASPAQELPTPEQTFAEKLQSLMQSKGMNREALAEAAKVSPGTISGWFHGAAPVKRTAEALAAALGVSADWLLNCAPPRKTRPPGSHASFKGRLAHPDLLRPSEVCARLSIDEYKMGQLKKRGALVLVDIREPGAPRPLWRVTWESYQAYLKALLTAAAENRAGIAPGDLAGPNPLPTPENGNAKAQRRFAKAPRKQPDPEKSV